MITLRHLAAAAGASLPTSRASRLIKRCNHDQARQAPDIRHEPSQYTQSMTADELKKLFSKPTWSVESLLPPKTCAPDAPRISSKQLHHLLRLSALPLPESPEGEQKMLDNLAAQLHFVGEIQKVDTTGYEPMRMIWDESKQGEEKQTISLQKLKGALAQEKVIGKHYKRIHRNTEPVDASEVEDWDTLGSANRKSGRYFVVESERPQE